MLPPLAARLSTVALVVTVGSALSACGADPAPPSAPATAASTVQSTSPGTPTATAAASSAPAATASQSTQRNSAALVPADAYLSKGYGRGQDEPAGTGPAVQVCATQLDIDRQASTHATVGRRWTSSRFSVRLTVHTYSPGSVTDAVKQIKAAAGSCTTYENSSVAMKIETVNTPQYYGIDAAHVFCEKAVGDDQGPGQCTAAFAHGGLLSVLRVETTAASTSDTWQELQRLADDAAAAIQTA